MDHLERKRSVDHENVIRRESYVFKSMGGRRQILRYALGSTDSTDSGHR